MTHDELLEYGFIYENGAYGLPSNILPPEAYMPSIMLQTDPKYPSFNPNQIPWSEAPTAVQEILSMGIDKANTVDMYSYQMPFVAVRVNSSNITVFVGVNCFLGVVEKTGNTRVCTLAGGYYPNFISYCYSAVFDRNLSIKTKWHQVNPTVWGDTGDVLTYSSQTFIADDYKVDLYVYGGNGARFNYESGSPSIFSIASTSSANVACVMNNKVGFNDGRVLWGSTSGFFADVYISTFNPPTIQEMEQETQKGIWESIKSIPDMIAEKFKGLFIPDEGFFDTYTQEFQDYFADRFGILYELPGAVVDIFQQLVDYQPDEEGYYIKFPEVVMPVLEDGEWSDVVLIEETEVRFDFLDEGPIATMYTMYRSALWLIFIFLLINLIIRKSEKVLGGASG